MECITNKKCYIYIYILILYLLSTLALAMVLTNCVSSEGGDASIELPPPERRNNPPIPTAPAILTTVNTPGTTQIEVNDPDADQNHIFTIDTSPQFGDIVVNLTGHVEYVPDPNYTGNDRAVIRVTDSGDAPLWSLVIISIIVSADTLNNSPPMPIAAVISTTVNTSGATQIDPNDPDIDQNHTFFIFTSPEHGTAEVDSAGVARYEPDSGFSGSDGFVVSVADSGSPPLIGTVFIAVIVDATTENCNLNEVARISINNAGFESFGLADNFYTIPGRANSSFAIVNNNPIPGWKLSHLNGRAGTWNPPVTSYPDEATEGKNVAYIDLNSPSVSQVIESVLSPETTYTLEVDIGHRLDISFPGYTIQLLAGGNVLAEDNSTLTPEKGTFITSTIIFTPPVEHPNLGDQLEIRLHGNGSQVNFDNVRLQGSCVRD